MCLNLIFRNNQAAQSVCWVTAGSLSACHSLMHKAINTAHGCLQMPQTIEIHSRSRTGFNSGVLSSQPQIILILQEVKLARNTRTVVLFKPMLEAVDTALHFALWGQTQRLANRADGS